MSETKMPNAEAWTWLFGEPGPRTVAPADEPMTDDELAHWEAECYLDCGMYAGQIAPLIAEIKRLRIVLAGGAT